MKQSSISNFFRPSPSSSKGLQPNANEIIKLQDSATKKRVREEISLIDDDDETPIISKPRTASSLKERFDHILVDSDPVIPSRRSTFQKAIFNEYKPQETEDDLDDNFEREILASTTTKVSYTPLELQVIAIRKQFPDCLLMVECGYRMRFFGDDALKAAKALGIYAHKDHNFMVGSVPTYRAAHHCQRLLSAGLKVAIVRQTETAALRKGTSVGSRTFDRKVAGVFTQGALIDDDDPAFDGLIASFQKKTTNTGDQSDLEDENDDDFEGKGLSDLNANHQISAKEEEDFWIASIHYQTDRITIAATNICAHKLWICDLPPDTIYQGLLDYLDVLKPIELIYPEDIPFEMKQRINDRIETGSFSFSSNDRRSQDYTGGYIKLVKTLSPNYFSQHRDRFFDGKSTGMKWYEEIPELNRYCIHGLFAYLKDFQLTNVFINPTIMITTSDASVAPGSENHSAEFLFSHQTHEKSSFALDGITVRDLEVLDTLANTNAKLKKAWKDLWSKNSLSFPSSSSQSPSSFLSMNKMKSLQQGLFGIIDCCRSVYGKRTLKSWLMNPLIRRELILQRQEAITWFLSSMNSSSDFSMIATKQKQMIFDIMNSCPEIEKLLTSLQYNRISFPKLIKLLQFSLKLDGFNSNIFQDLSQYNGSSQRLDENRVSMVPNQFPELPPLLKEWIHGSIDWKEIKKLALSYLSQLRSSNGEAENQSIEATQQDTISPYFTFETEQSYAIFIKLRQRRQQLKQNLEQELQLIQQKLKKPNLVFTTFRSGTNSQIEHLIELSNQDINTAFKNSIPSNWIKVNTTKQITRYHTPEVLQIQDELYKVRDEGKIYSLEIWKQFIQTIIQELYPLLRQAIDILGKLDAILSLSIVASYPDYCKPIYPENSNEVKIVDGRHPILEKSLEFLSLMNNRNQTGNKMETILTSPSSYGISLRKPSTDSLIPNDVNLTKNFEARHCQIVTGPNMGGKSSYVRMVGLLILLGQIGSYIPASSASLCTFENIFTRMGSEDDLSSGRSTFMCELIRTKKILSSVNSHSLVIIDELGRGTSTHDGQAIAQASLEYLISRIGCCTMFITHFPQIAAVTQKLYPKSCFNSHMSYVERNKIIEAKHGEDDDEHEIIFLYKVVDEASKGSYGVNVARLAGIPRYVLQNAVEMSSWMTSQTRCNTLSEKSSDVLVQSK